MKRTLTILLIVAVILGGLAAFDVMRAQTFDISVVSVSPEKPVADVRERVQIKILLSRHGKPVKGHSLFAIPKNGGALKGNRVETDENGLAMFVYCPYTETKLQPAKPVTIEVIDESNSVFFEINARLSFRIDLQPRQSKKSG